MYPPLAEMPPEVPSTSRSSPPSPSRSGGEVEVEVGADAEEAVAATPAAVFHVVGVGPGRARLADGEVLERRAAEDGGARERVAVDDAHQRPAVELLDQLRIFSSPVFLEKLFDLFLHVVRIVAGERAAKPGDRERQRDGAAVATHVEGEGVGHPAVGEAGVGIDAVELLERALGLDEVLDQVDDVRVGDGERVAPAVGGDGEELLGRGGGGKSRQQEQGGAGLIADHVIHLNKGPSWMVSPIGGCGDRLLDRLHRPGRLALINGYGASGHGLHVYGKPFSTSGRTAG